jgi:hypothetical protein
MVAKKRKESKKKEKKSEKERKIVLAVASIFGLVIVFIVAGTFFENIGKFEHDGLTYTKQKYGEITMYHYYYFFNNDQGGLVKYNLYLRVDPRENDVPVEGEVIFPQNRFAYLSVNNTGLSQCNLGNLATVNLALFLEHNGIETRSASPDQEDAELKNIEYADCSTHPRNVVILAEQGEETKITREGYCYKIEVADCEMLEAFEKFQTQAIIDGRQ